MNLISNDAQRMEQIIFGLILSFTYLVSFPFTIAIMYALVGWQSLSGPLVVMFISLLMVLTSKVYGKPSIRASQFNRQTSCYFERDYHRDTSRQDVCLGMEIQGQSKETEKVRKI